MERVSGRTLVVMRHAKAEAGAASDAERALAASGRADAGVAGRWLAGQVAEPGRALVSAAVRTRQTFEQVAAAAGWTLAPDLDAGLYAADVDSALDLIGLTDEGCDTILVVGHNPTVGQLAALLDDGGADPALADHLLTGFPTCALAVFGVDVAWSDLAPGTARLRSSHVGRA